MGLRYEEASDEAVAMVKEIRAQHFPELKNAKIKVLYDLKKRKSGGMMVLARIMKTNDLLRHLTIEEAGAVDGYDYIITLDKLCWQNIDRTDKERLIRHELRHTSFDLESETSPYKLQDHTITDFYEEIELNKNDPRWRERLSTLVNDMYEQQKEARQEKKKKLSGGLS